MMNKVLVNVFVPMIQAEYDVWLTLNKKVYKVIKLLVKSINELSGGHYAPDKMPMLYDKTTAKMFDINLTVKENDIKNGTEIVLI